MAPKKKKKKSKDKVPEFKCEDIEGERFYTQTDDINHYSCWEVFCFPYMICSKFWDCCVTLCASANQCLVYLLLIQWCICKCKRVTTPDPIVYPYYFYMFCQIFVLTAVFIVLWVMLGPTVILPFIYALYNALGEDYSIGKIPPPQMKVAIKNVTRMSFRKYCFKKGELFGPLASSSDFLQPYTITLLLFLLIKLFNK